MNARVLSSKVTPVQFKSFSKQSWKLKEKINSSEI